ncbi:hypothetical protein GIB67_013358 [Kingdonia uniflora]|uniref:Uncharacterized protein n=1 Tax=Kingdonia uniflora TaxID=39325 RepID=A0A7J7LQV4_9MAGN|nr:hypothetical protein GIB67_013358 [Kingdonia uniflora]
METVLSGINSSDSNGICYASKIATTNGVWDKENPLKSILPLLLMQMMLILGTTRFLVFIFKPLRQPRVISEILGGVVLGRSMLGRITPFIKALFPFWSIAVLESVSNMGLLFFLFQVGVEMDIVVIKRTGRKAIAIAVAGMALPFLIGTSAILLSSRDELVTAKDFSFAIFVGVAVSTTAFPVLARVLAELKLLNTDLGRIALSAAVLNDMCAWILLVLGIAISENGNGKSIASILEIFTSFVFMLFLIFAVRPGIEWMVRRTPNGENFSDFLICMILTGVMVCGLFTEAMGIRSIIGAFVFGLIIPSGPLADTLVERLDDFVTTLLLPLYFALTGIRTDFTLIKGRNLVLTIIIVLASIGKVIGTLIIGLYYNMPFNEGFTLALLMNTKGLIELIVINVGRDQKVLDDEIFSLLVLMAVVMTSVITPSVLAIYKPANDGIRYKRTIQRLKPDAELRILACVHTPKNVPSIISLLEISNPTSASPISIYALQLVELTGRASAMLIVHHTHKDGRSVKNRTQAQSQKIINALENFVQNVQDVSAQFLTAISPYSTMHEDICNLAEDKQVAFIILPFHKKPTADGDMEVTNPVLRTLNKKVLANAPCSVGILIDRGLRAPDQNISHHIAILFFGGPDDREALSYAWRMAEDMRINLTVFRYLQEVESRAMEYDPNPIRDGRILSDREKEKQLDDEYITEFKLKMLSNKDKVTYKEKVLSNTEETVIAVRSMENTYDLFIVGRGRGIINPLTSSFTDWSECPELGGIGDLLASSDSMATVSVLVVQQYIGPEIDEGDGEGITDSQEQQSDLLICHYMLRTGKEGGKRKNNSQEQQC